MLKQLFHTLVHLKLIQIGYQIRYRIAKPKYHWFEPPKMAQSLVLYSPIPKYRCKEGTEFFFLNQRASFQSWNDTRQGMLWAYNLNYMDWLLQDDLSIEEGAQWIHRFVNELPQNRIGLDPYPIALRGINWIKFIILHREQLGKEQIQQWNKALFSQYCLLTKKLEFHLLGNHLLEDAYSLFFAAIYFADKKLYLQSTQLLHRELREQILPDGAHYEQSPMYHCILLDRLLDCYNLASCNPTFKGQERFSSFLKNQATLMLGHLNSMLYEDGTYPLFNDSATDIAPTPEMLFRYARRLEISWKKQVLHTCGYRHLKNETFESFVDVGNIRATYQPGHTHADTFSYELRIKGEPFIVDTGISTYNKTQRRQLERSTPAHNTVTLSQQDSSEVWGGFRVGYRAQVSINLDERARIEAIHDGFGKKACHQRNFALQKDSFKITDVVHSEKTACSYIHFAPGITILSFDNQSIYTSKACIRLENAEVVEIDYGKASSTYNRFYKIAIAKIHFKKYSTYSIYPSHEHSIPNR